MMSGMGDDEKAAEVLSVPQRMRSRVALLGSELKPTDGPEKVALWGSYHRAALTAGFAAARELVPSSLRCSRPGCSRDRVMADAEADTAAGPRARKLWALLQERGLETLCETHVNAALDAMEQADVRDRRSRARMELKLAEAEAIEAEAALADSVEALRAAGAETAREFPRYAAAAKRLDAVLTREGVRELREIYRPCLGLMALGTFLDEAVSLPGSPKAEMPPEVRPTGFIRTDIILAAMVQSHVAGDDRQHLSLFAAAWASVGFPVVRVGEKQAAAMMLTEPPEDVAPPWPACVITVPGGLVMAGKRMVTHILTTEQSDFTGAVLVDRDGVILIDDFPGGEEEARRVQDMLRNLRLSLYAAIEAGTHVQTESYRGRSFKGGKTKNRGYREAPPPGTAYVVRAPVTIDLREIVREHLASGRKGGAPRVQFVVRGHWRNQAHGAGRALRRRQWIEPFWKGPRDAVAAIRAYKVKGAGDGDP